MKAWIEYFFEEPLGDKCTAHKDRPAVALLKKQAKDNAPITITRRYCHECLQKKLARDPKIPVHRIPILSDEY